MPPGGDQSGVCGSAATRYPIWIFSVAAHLHLLHARVHLPHASVLGLAVIIVSKRSKMV
jgi:hypothetical protein